MSLNRKVKCLVLGGLFASGVCLADYRVDCPPVLEYEVSVPALPEGWSGPFRPGYSSRVPATTLKRVAEFRNAILYFEGEVEDRIELKGRSDPKYRGMKADVVELEPDKEHSAMCLYADGLVLWKKLPRGLKQCVNIEEGRKTDFREFCSE